MPNLSVYYLNSHQAVSVGFSAAPEEFSDSATAILSCALQGSMGWIAFADMDGRS